MKSKSSTFILIIVALVVISGGIYYFVSKKPSNTSTSQTGLVSSNSKATTGSIPTAANGAAGSQVITLLRNLSTIQLSDAVFQNPNFSLFRDLGVPLPTATNLGKRNPFASAGYSIPVEPEATIITPSLDTVPPAPRTTTPTTTR